MDSSQVHLAFNHFPIAGVFFSLLFFGAAIITQKENLKAPTVFLVLISGLLLLPVFYSGEGVERIVKRKPFISRYHIHEHEESAEKTMVVMMVATAMAGGWLVMKKMNKKYTNELFYLIFIMNFVTAWSVANTAHEGGMIRHDQIRHGEGSHLELMD